MVLHLELETAQIFGGEIVKNLSIAGAHFRFDAFCRPGSYLLASVRIVGCSIMFVTHAVAVPVFGV